ncbi:unknown [Eggerthella sp. CAG:1427]|nr:unknown [Eggerthella sp. CAG:1427]
MKCTDCAYYAICKDLIKAGFKGINEIFPEIGGCEVFNLKHEEKVKECDKKMQPAVTTALQAILADRGYKVLELKTFSGATFVGTDIKIKFNNFLLTKCVYCNDVFFSTIQNISEVRILFFS